MTGEVSGAAGVVVVPTPHGPCRLHVHSPQAPDGDPVATPRGTLVLGHGAGGGIGAMDLQALAARLPGLGWQVVLVEMAWVVAGRRIATAPATLDAQWLPICDRVRQLSRAARLVVGGRSAGARVACRTAVAVGAEAVLALAFPLHPPGRPERSRADELRAPVEAGLPVHVVQGERDAFGTPAEVIQALGRGGAAMVSGVPGPHGFAKGAAPAVVSAAQRFLATLD